MKEKLSSWLKLDQLIENLTGYIDTKLKLTKLQIQEELSLGLSKLLIACLQVLLFCWILFFISVTFALFMGELLGSYAQGFAILSVISLLKVVVLFWKRKRIIQYIMSRVAKNLVQNLEETNENNESEPAG